MCVCPLNSIKSDIYVPYISEKSPAIPKAPTPNTKHAQSKIGSLNNVKHSPGGGNVSIIINCQRLK